MFNKYRGNIYDRVRDLEMAVKRLQKQYDDLSDDYKFLSDKVDYIIVKAHCPVCGSEMRLEKKVFKNPYYNLVMGIEYYLTCPKDNYTVAAPTLKGVFDKIPKKD